MAGEPGNDSKGQQQDGGNAEQQQAGGGKPWTPPASQEEFDRIIGNRINRALKPYEGLNVEELKTKAQRLAEIEQGDMTEAQKEKTRADTLAQNNTTLATENARLKAGVEYRNLTIEDLNTLSGTPEEIMAAAKRWSERLSPPPPEFDGGRRGGAAPAGNDMNAIIRRAAGVGR